MSDVKQTGEVEKKVLISNEDMENVRNYSIHFGVPVSEDLEKSMKIFESNPTYENMLEFKLQVCIWLTHCQHESFKDKLWDHPKAAATDSLYDLQFDKDLKEELAPQTLDSNGQLTAEGMELLPPFKKQE